MDTTKMTTDQAETTPAEWAAAQAEMAELCANEMWFEAPTIAAVAPTRQLAGSALARWFAGIARGVKALVPAFSNIPGRTI